MCKPQLIESEILENRELSAHYYLMKINSPELANAVRPGQFFHIKVSDRLDLLLRRPFSIFDYDTNSISILYEIAGKGTEALSQKRHGDLLDILGPLGDGFSVDNNVKKAIVAGGGMGVAPLFCLVKELKRQTAAVDVILGFRSQYNVICEEDFKKIGIVPEIATDDGSYGYSGLVTELLKEKLKNTGNGAQDTIIFACGPNAMLKQTAGIIMENNIKGQLSLDRHMGCGIGVCLGCVVKGSGGKYKRVCKDGPVFSAEELAWD